MLPSLGFNEIIILGILALVVVGPKDLPLLFRKLGKWTAKLRGMAQEFRTGFDELARQAELDELKREVQALRRTTNLGELAREITKPLPTLEDYAGISKPTPVVPERMASSSMEEAPRSGGGGARVEGEDEPLEGAPVEPSVAPPQSSLRDDSSSIEEERKALDVPEHADAAPIARSAP
ncbi:Sec-independent protein translocase protein TatB [Terricaulis silvestris]|uniref:Sec-independent protein translocase protein TatB n=1 Tax=Terricaulis silvestris TaxID=2686094 RepID=A0A6I6MPX3_9CAUL|nr:Sec-independent protein translocase protein TatB [Terricaulis silvestris]QGZ94837.1 Sec-independent protein translocase protein TatB [Terricaulis silvestris]